MAPFDYHYVKVEFETVEGSLVEVETVEGSLVKVEPGGG